MASEARQPLLSEGDPSPVRVTNRAGRSLFLLLGDHAGNLVPERLGTLGLAPGNLGRHIALDIGVSDLGRGLATSLDAPFVEQRYSRLMVDCNRSIDAADRMARVSDRTPIPGNMQLDAAGIARRNAEIFEPYHAEIAQILDHRAALGEETVLVSLHSFTPTWNGQSRPWDIGVLHDGGDTRFAHAVLRALQIRSPWCVGDNVPYRMDRTDFTVPRHAYGRGLGYVEIEVNQRRLSHPDLIAEVCRTLAHALSEALENLG